jgi:hypothetical protein
LGILLVVCFALVLREVGYAQDAPDEDIGLANPEEKPLSNVRSVEREAILAEHARASFPDARHETAERQLQ